MRPEHLNCPNTVAGIDRINEMQREYDRDPEAYERKEILEREQIEEERYFEMIERERQERESF